MFVTIDADITILFKRFRSKGDLEFGIHLPTFHASQLKRIKSPLSYIAAYLVATKATPRCVIQETLVSTKTISLLLLRDVSPYPGLIANFCRLSSSIFLKGGYTSCITE